MEYLKIPWVLNMFPNLKYLNCRELGINARFADTSIDTQISTARKLFVFGHFVSHSTLLVERRRCFLDFFGETAWGETLVFGILRSAEIAEINKVK